MPVSVYNAQAVMLGSKAYIGGGSMDPGSFSRLLVYNCTKDSWDILDTPTQWYALTTYRSQLVLIGGVNPNTGRATNQLWLLDDQGHWTQPLPPMATKHYQASAVGVGDHLIVAGGCGGSDGSPLNMVEVCDGHQWKQAHSVPRTFWCTKSALHEGKWYLGGGMGLGKKVYYTSLDSLIASSEGLVQRSMWKKLHRTPMEFFTLVSLGNQLITVGGGYPSTASIYAYSPTTNSWVHAADLPVACCSPCTVVLPTGELLMVETLSSLSFRAKIEGHLDLCLCMGICSSDISYTM